MSEKPLVKVEHVSKKFCRSLKRSLWYGVKDLAGELTAQNGEGRLQLRPDEFLAVDDVSFELHRGECLGLIGANGAGKSTLLKLLNGLVRPDAGRITVRGRVGALIELGAGFNPILTGRENVYINGAVLGLSKKEIDARFDEIVEFAELGEFIDTPVQSYSSGMTVRLGFAVAAQTNPDILLIDEVLAVGDVSFRTKCFNRIYKTMQTASVIFVSHDMPEISRVCTNIIVMNKGLSCYQGKPMGKGIQTYYSTFPDRNSPLITESGKAVVEKVEFLCNGVSQKTIFNYRDYLGVLITLKFHHTVTTAIINLSILGQEQQILAEANSLNNGFNIKNNQQLMKLKINLGEILLSPGYYSLSITIHDNNLGEVYAKYYNISKFQVIGDKAVHAPIQLYGEWSLEE